MKFCQTRLKERATIRQELRIKTRVFRMRTCSKITIPAMVLGLEVVELKIWVGSKTFFRTCSVMLSKVKDSDREREQHKDKI